MSAIRTRLSKGGDLELVGRKEAAEILGVATGNLTPPKRGRGGVRGLPEPVVTYLAAGILWLRVDIEALAAERAAERDAA